MVYNSLWVKGELASCDEPKDFKVLVSTLTKIQFPPKPWGYWCACETVPKDEQPHMLPSATICYTQQQFFL